MRLDPNRLQLGISGVPTSGTVFWGGSTSESLMGISCAVCALPAPLLAWTAGILQSMRISPHLTGAEFWVDLDVGSFVGNSCAVCALLAALPAWSASIWLPMSVCPCASDSALWGGHPVRPFEGNSCAVCALSATWLFVNFHGSRSSGGADPGGMAKRRQWSSEAFMRP